ncbi:unnamed protein product, partial [Pelagomonas calceolata]
AARACARSRRASFAARCSIAACLRSFAARASFQRRVARASRSWIVASWAAQDSSSAARRASDFASASAASLAFISARARSSSRGLVGADDGSDGASGVVGSSSSSSESERSDDDVVASEASPSDWKRPRRAVVRFFTVIGDVGTGVAIFTCSALRDCFALRGLLVSYGSVLQRDRAVGTQSPLLSRCAGSRSLLALGAPHSAA